MKLKSHCEVFKGILTTIILIVYVSFACKAQNCTPNPGDDANNYHRPYMWFHSDKNLVDNFKNNKYAKLVTPNKSQPQSFVLKNFGGLIDYFCSHYKDSFECLRVVIAQFSAYGTPMVPKGWGDSLVLLFVPATSYDNIKQDLGYYFFPANEPFDETKINDFKIDTDKYPNLPGEWIDNYRTKLLYKLEPTLNHDPKNHDDDDGPGKKSDTKWITYCASGFKELRREQLYTHKVKKVPVTLSSDMLASFAAFDEKGNVSKYNHYKMRLFVQFDFINAATNQAFSLEDSDGFSSRKPAKGQCGNCTRNQNEKSIW